MQKKPLPPLFNTVSVDITRSIFRYLDEASLLAVSKTCNAFYFIGNDLRIWNEKLSNRGFSLGTLNLLPVANYHPKPFYFLTKKCTQRSVK